MGKHHTTRKICSHEVVWYSPILTKTIMKWGGMSGYGAITVAYDAVLYGKDFVGHSSVLTSVASGSSKPSVGDGNSLSNASTGVSKLSQSRLMCGRSSL